MDTRIFLLSLFCIGILLVAGCTTTTPAPATPVPATEAPVETLAVPETPAPVMTPEQSPVETTVVPEGTTAAPAKVSTPAVKSPVKIFSPTSTYSPKTSSLPGLDLSVITSLDTSTAKFAWSASDGYFVTWAPSSSLVNVVGPTITTNGGKVYWTFGPSHPKDSLPVTITVVVNEASGRELGRSTATLTWPAADTVKVQEIV